ncbi:MAG: hypothetical protein PHQ72_06660 [Hespellia sp.]|nr:hypothetical protein [Hespellia sp.]
MEQELELSKISREDNSMKRQGTDNKKGSALLIAIVIMMVTMMLGLALLLVSYSLFSTANKQRTMEQCKEMSQSVSKELEQEIAIKEFENYDAQKASLEAGDNLLYFYIRYNIWQDSWPYYNPDERGHTSEYAYRYFDLNGIDEMNNTDVTILMYWECDSDWYEGGASDKAEIDKNGTNLIVKVICQKGKQKSTITNTYTLQSGTGADGWGAPATDSTKQETANPNSNMIYPQEKWTFEQPERE